MSLFIYLLTSYLSNIAFITPLSSIPANIFLKMINNIGPIIKPVTFQSLYPVYIAIKVNIGCMPICPLTIRGSTNCLTILITHHKANIPIANFISPEKAKIPAQGIITVPEPKIGKASTKAIPNCNY